MFLFKILKLKALAAMGIAVLYKPPRSIPTPLYGHAPSNPTTNKVLLMIMNKELQQQLGLVPNSISDMRKMWDLSSAIV